MNKLTLIALSIFSISLTACGDKITNVYELSEEDGGTAYDPEVETVEEDTGTVPESDTDALVDADAGTEEDADVQEDASTDAIDPVTPVTPTTPVVTPTTPVEPTTPTVPVEPTPAPAPVDFCKDSATRSPVTITNGRVQLDTSWITEKYRSTIEVCGNFSGMSWTSCVSVTDTDGDGRPDFAPPAADVGRTCIHFTYRANVAVWAMYGALSGKCVAQMSAPARSFVWSNPDGTYELSLTPGSLTGCSNL